MLRPSLFLFLFVVWSCLDAGVYKWTDDQGNVHFGDRPPAKGAEEVKVPESAPSPAPATKDRKSTQQRMLEMYREDREKKKLEKAKRKQEATQLAKKCENARNQLRKYQNSRALYDKLPGGERRFLTDEEREKTIAELQKAIGRNCR